VARPPQEGRDNQNPTGSDILPLRSATPEKSQEEAKLLQGSSNRANAASRVFLQTAFALHEGRFGCCVMLFLLRCQHILKIIV